MQSRPVAIRLVALLGALAVLGTACAGAEDTTPQQPGAATTPATGGDGGGSPPAEPQPAADQELIAAYGDDQFATSEANKKTFASYPLNANICETPLQLTRDFQVDPRLATNWEYVGNNTFRFTIPEGITYHNGEPLTAESFAAAINYYAEDPPVGVARLSFLGPASAKVTGENTVEVTPEESNLRLIEEINHPEFAVIAPGNDPLADLQAAGGRLTAEQGGPVCTGPFRFVEYVENERLVVERNPDYWGEPAKLDRITFRFIPDESTRVLALQSGEVDLIADVERTLVPELEAQPGIKIVRAPPGQVHLFYIARRTADGEPLVTDNPEVRRAIAHAMDREAYVNGVLGGEGELVDTVSPPSVLGDDVGKVEGIPHDPEAARQALEDAGWTQGDDGVYQRDGQRLEVRIVFSAARNTVDQATWIQGQLQDVGFDAEVLQLEAAAYRERLNSGDYEIDLSVPNQNNANPAFLLGLRWYSKSRIPNAAIVAPGPDTEFDALLDQIQETADPDELQRLSAEAMHQLVDVEIGVVALAGTYRIYAMKEQVQGFEPHPSGINQAWDTVFISE